MSWLNKEKFFTLVGSIFISGILLYLLWLSLSFFVISIVSIDPKISAAIIGAMATTFIGLASIIINQRQTKTRDIEEAHRGKKIEIYQKILNTIASLITQQDDQITIKSSQEIINQIIDFKTEILLCSSPKVIQSQLEFQKISVSNGNISIALNNLCKAIREDIGLSNKGLNNFEFTKIFLEEPNKLDKIKLSKKIE